MIKKLQTLDDIPTNTIIEKSILTICSAYTNKINELCDIINTIQKEREAERFEIQEWIDILEAVRKSVNIHEKEIDELQMKIEPEKCETPAETVQQVSYMAPGDITVFHGFNCSVEFDIPLPKGTRITIKSINKGEDNE
jgi:aspartokinase